jgi:hypothetical protein
VDFYGYFSLVLIRRPSGFYPCESVKICGGEGLIGRSFECGR